MDQPTYDDTWLDAEARKYREWLEAQAQDIAARMLERSSHYAPAGMYRVATFESLLAEGESADRHARDGYERAYLYRRILARVLTHVGVTNMPDTDLVDDWHELLVDVLPDEYDRGPYDDDLDDDE